MGGDVNDEAEAESEAEAEAEAELREGQRTLIPVSTAANLIMATAEGRVAQFARSGFKRPPTEGWKDQWSTLSKELMKPSRPI